MNTTELNMPNTTILDSLNKSMSYQEYIGLVNVLVERSSTTGNEKTEALANYTMLNQRRMRRWDKTVKLSDKAKAKIENYSGKMTWLVLTESWCGDAAHIMPVINKVAELNGNINYRVVLRDENDVLMNQFLTNGGRSIPKLIAIDEESKEVVGTFGPRPSVATELVNAYKEKHGALTPEFKEDLQRWYNKDKGQSAVSDLLNLLN
ncbi:thioredoxin family protein [Winogradskyella sp. DF17]|jgi:thiol-disulfide isomerase/thioredoxin|uniref:Thioredoxin family protein n=1 Tax=Winogradskyella pelagia TaxID=2819984 RepID=A0ABS3T581_9FLAO|nr:thioredoxin family protein [Winogradskyella sp. DF17]MBO3117906.1 thioredoxin family protein [Winogradskyella sp. DF17]